MSIAIIISEHDGKWHVSMNDGSAIYPTSIHPTKRLAVSRVLQLLDIGPVAPQIHPEEVCIGEIE